MENQTHKIVGSDGKVWATGTFEDMTAQAASLKAQMPSRFFFVGVVS